MFEGGLASKYLPPSGPTYTWFFEPNRIAIQYGDAERHLLAREEPALRRRQHDGVGVWHRRRRVLGARVEQSGVVRLLIRGGESV